MKLLTPAQGPPAPRRSTWVIAAALVSVVAILGFLTLQSLASDDDPAKASPAATPTVKPNVLMVMLDDARFDVWAMLPKTSDLLLKAGVNYTGTTTPNPNCCPARAATMSGRYPHNNGVRTQSDAMMLDQEHTIQSYLSKAGYRTSMAGKYLISWPDKVAPPYFDDYTYIKGGYYNYYPFIGSKGKDGVTMFKATDDASYSTTFLTSQLQASIDGFVRADATKPWYGLLTYQAPHLDQPLSQDSATPEVKYQKAAVPRCADQKETDKTDKPPWIRFWNVPAEVSNTTCTSQERSLISVDDSVAGLLGHLRDTKQLDNTLVIFTSDNGFMWHENDLTQKFTPYSPSIRVPLAMAWPGHLGAGTTDTRRISLVDLLPTILDAAKLQPDAAFVPDGYSILTKHDRRLHYNEYWYDTENSLDLPSWAHIRTNVTRPPYNGDVLSLHRWYSKEATVAGAVSAEEVYNVTKDPGEDFNLLGDKDSANDPPPEVLNELRAALEAAHTCAGSSCP